MKTTTFFLFALAMVAMQARAQVPAANVWRCGADGSSYSSVPCAQGRLLDVGTGDRPAADVQAAQQIAARDRQQADRLRADRRHQEAQNGSGLVAITSDRTPAMTPLTSKARARATPRQQPLPKTRGRHQQPQQPQQQQVLQQLGAVAPAAADTWRATAPPSPRTKG